MKLERVEPAWARLHRESAKALLRAEAAMLRELRAALRSAAGRALLSLSDDADRTHALLVVRQAVKDAALALEHALVHGKTSARRVALHRVAAEVALLTRQLEAHGFDGPEAPEMSDGSAEDAALAQTAAGSLASAWGASVIAGIARWSDDPTSTTPIRAARAAVDQVDYRLRRTAATETSRSFNDEHAEALDEIADANDGATWLPAIWKRWDAMLDRKVCQACKDHDGETAFIGFAFDGGDKPGEMHANCRCIETMVFLPVRLPEKEAA